MRGAPSDEDESFSARYPLRAIVIGCLYSPLRRPSRNRMPSSATCCSSRRTRPSGSGRKRRPPGLLGSGAASGLRDDYRLSRVEAGRRLPAGVRRGRRTEDETAGSGQDRARQRRHAGRVDRGLPGAPAGPGRPDGSVPHGTLVPRRQLGWPLRSDRVSDIGRRDLQALWPGRQHVLLQREAGQLHCVRDAAYDSGSRLNSFSRAPSRRRAGSGTSRGPAGSSASPGAASRLHRWARIFQDGRPVPRFTVEVSGFEDGKLASTNATGNLSETLISRINGAGGWYETRVAAGAYRVWGLDNLRAYRAAPITSRWSRSTSRPSSTTAA